MLFYYFKTAWRNLKRSKVYATINIGGLATGLASCLLLLLYVAYQWGYDKQFRNVENIYTIENNQTGDGKIFTFMATPEPLAQTIQSEVPGVVRTVRTTDVSTEILSYGNNSFRKNGLFADSLFFLMFSYHFIEGNPNTALLQPNSVVLTKSLAQTLFGKESALNRFIRRNNKADLMVTGVIADPPANSSLQFDYVMPWALYAAENDWVKTAGWSSNMCYTYVQLQSLAHFKSADALIRKMINAHQDDYKGEAFLFPFAKQHLYGKFENGKSVGGLIEQVKLFLGLALGILGIACINFMNLSTARSGKKAVEVGIRKTLGSSRTELVRQFIAESLFYSFLAMVLAIGIVYLCLPFFNRLLHIQLQLPLDNWRFCAVLVLLVVITGLVAGSYPAFYLSSFQPLKVLKGLLGNGKGAFSIRRALVVLQFGFSVSLIVATIVISKQIRFIENRPIGYDNNNLVQLTVEGELGNKLDVFKDEVLKSGAAVAACKFMHSITQGGYNGWGVSWPGMQPNEKVLFDFFNTSYGFTQTTGVKMLQGRDFSEAFPADTTGLNVLINETAAKLMHASVGTQIEMEDIPPLTIIGVFQDFIKGSPSRKVAPMLVRLAGNGANIIAMKLNPAQNISSSISKIEKIVKNLNPGFPADIRFTDESFANKFESEKQLRALSVLFGGLCIFISCLGLLGLSLYAAEQRTKEIGMRKVLGAGVPHIVLLLSKEFVGLVCLSFLIAFPLSWWAMNGWLQHYEYRISITWWLFALAGLVAIVIALATVSFQAIKAATANPVKSLRTE